MLDREKRDIGAGLYLLQELYVSNIRRRKKSMDVLITVSFSEQSLQKIDFSFKFCNTTFPAGSKQNVWKSIWF